MTSLVLSLVMVICLLPAMGAVVKAETGYDRGYRGGMAGDGKIYAHGLDVSAWQESGLNFKNFANAGYDYVILRCGTTYGKDKCFDEYYASAKAAGLDVGCYYYSYATSVAAAKSDARNMIDWMKGKVFEYPIYFDYEDPSQNSIGGSGAASICLAFMDMLKAEGYLVGLYSMSSWLKASWVTTSGIRSTYEGWVAHLPSTENNTGITSNLYNVLHSTYSTAYGMHQYSFTTYVNGAGPFDANVCYKDYPDIVKTFGFNGYEQTETWIEKAAFDVMVYRDRNPDLAGMTDAQLKEHWLNHGIKEGRPSSTVLDLGFYLNNNPDLKTAFGTDYEKVYNHFVTKGYKEYRKSSALFDGRYYCDKYPDVATNYKENYLLHYMDHGMKEGRRASLTYDPNYYLFIRPDVAEVWPNDYSMAARHYAGHGINAQIEAYDHQHPVITDVTISDVTANGYTVTCKVTDDWGVSKVVFPAWTVLNDQDDLPANFMNTQKGTKNGDTYTFRVNASEHNNEEGMYVTHIYAVDKGGNQTQLVLDNVEVKGTATRITPTGATVCLEADRNQRALIVMKGDVNGDGIIDSTDYVRIKSHFLERTALTGAYLIAADCDDSGTITATDYLRLKSYFLKEFDLFA